MKNKIVLGIAGALITLAGYFVGMANIPAQLGMTSRSQASCTVTQSKAIIGHQASLTILAAHTNRAWAIIQTPSGATSTASLSFDEGAAAVAGTGILLNATTSDTTYNPIRQSIEFGINTPFAYNGAITGINSYGSSTLSVVECVF